MKIFFVTDYFYPFTPGGAEWSVYELAASLKKKKVQPIIVSLNYGAARQGFYKGLKIERLPFYKKVTDKQRVISPIWQNNPIFFMTSAISLMKLIRKEKPEVIHVNGKFLIPAAVIAGFISNIPVVITLRDKQILCSIGKCFFDKSRLKACNFWQYLTEDLPWFWANYVKNKNLLTLAYISLGAVWTRLAFEIIKLFAKRAQAIITISNSQKIYLEKNGFGDVQVIYNNAQFSAPISKVQTVKSVLFAGKLSKGKGAEVLAIAVKNIIKKEKVKFLFVGTTDLKSFYEDILTRQELVKYIKFMGSLDHGELTKLYKRVSAVVMPSIYPEAFGRVVVESLSCGTPAVVANTGALPEIVDDKITGRVVEPKEEKLEEAILDVVRNERVYKENIKKVYRHLKNRFCDTPIKQHFNLYRSLVK